MMSIKLPLWLRFVLLVGVVVFAAGAGLLGYRYYTRPVTLTVAVGSIDGEAAKAMSAIAGEFVSTNAPVRLKVIDSGTALEAANAFSAGKVDLAVVRCDVGDLSQAQAVIFDSGPTCSSGLVRPKLGICGSLRSNPAGSNLVAIAGASSRILCNTAMGIA
jgi:hypothetical protein